MTRQNHNSLLFATRTSWWGRTTSRLSATCMNLQSCTTLKCALWSPKSSTPTVVLSPFTGTLYISTTVCAPGSVDCFLIFRYYTGSCKSLQTASYLWRCNHSCLLRPEHGRHGPSHICSGRGSIQTDGQVLLPPNKL